MNKLILLVIYHAKEGCARAFVDELEKSGVADLVRAEDGCICYDYYFDAKNENAVLLYEEWESEEKQKAHVAQPHMSAVRAAKEKYIESTTFKRIK